MLFFPLFIFPSFQDKVLIKQCNMYILINPFLAWIKHIDSTKLLIYKMSIETVPADLRNLRACLVCSLVKSEDQFMADGCDNCERFLNIKGDIDKCYECTSANFDGLIAVCEPNDSWVCKWQKINRKCQGVYAVSVSGTLPRHIVGELSHMGIKYKSGQRDKSVK